MYSPISGTWSTMTQLGTARTGQAVSLLPSGKILVSGGRDAVVLSSAELYEVPYFATARRPVISSAPGTISYGTVMTVTGTGFRGDSEASSGNSQNSVSNFPITRLRHIESDRVWTLRPDARANFSDDPMTLQFSSLPTGLTPGLYFLWVTTHGVPSAASLTTFGCSIAITQQPVNQVGTIGATATFSITVEGANQYQWQKNGTNIPGATTATYTTPPLTGGDSGTAYRCVVSGSCSSVISDAATLTIFDVQDPAAAVVYPSGGEYWLLSPASGPANTQVVSWSMSDNVRICRVDVSLLYSNDGGGSWLAAGAGGGLPATFGSAIPCVSPGIGTSNLTYTIPSDFPSNIPGSLYKIRVVVTDHANNDVTAESASPFYIVQPNPGTVKTLILSNLGRMQAVQGISVPEAAALGTKLEELADHPRVQGKVVDFGSNSDVAALLAAWDADPGNADKANAVLFGCHVPLPSGCSIERNGIHDSLRTLLAAYRGVENLVIVGDDRIFPFARVADRTTLLPESSYPSVGPGQNLTPTGSTVGRALAANKYLSDDPIGVVDPIRSDALSGVLYVPDLKVGRLVESPAEITSVISTFISQDGVLDLAGMDPVTGHKVLIAGYDFLSDSSRIIRKRWKNAFGVPPNDPDLAPVDGSLIGGNWSLPTVNQRITALRDHLAGNGGARYGVVSLNGHAAHFEEGVPGTDPLDIKGLDAIDINGIDSCATASLGAVNLAASVIYAVGCHGGLPVALSCATNADHSLDLPQTMASRGVVAYLANTGYGWGLKNGIGYSERLVELMTEEMTLGGSIEIGNAVRESKRRYFLESPRFDPYDEKSVMEWALLGLPMYTVVTGISTGSPGKKELDSLPDGTSVERFGDVIVSRKEIRQDEAVSSLPPFVTQLTLHFDFSAAGVYKKYLANGDLAAGAPGCIDPLTSLPNPDGCYYTLNGLVERSTGGTDLPIQPYFIYDSRLSGTSEHGVIWKGGTFKEESGWIPVIAELASNGGDGSNHGGSPRVAMGVPIGPRIVPGQDPSNCRPSDTELNSLLVTAGEALRQQVGDPAYTKERTYRTVDLEVFYFNDTVTPPNNCDRRPPDLGAPPFAGKYHQVSNRRVDWGVPASDLSGVWRVIVVWNDGRLDGSGQGLWTPQELTYKASSGRWEGSLTTAGTLRLTYVIEAIDNRGNVRWFEWVSTGAADKGDDGWNSVDSPDALPASGVPLGSPDPVDADLADGDNDGMADAWEIEVGLNPSVNDAVDDPDLDGLSNFVEFGLNTLPNVQDTDGDGDNDGSEQTHSHNPLVPKDGHVIQITLTPSGGNIIVDWTADAANASGPFYVYRGTLPTLSPDDLRDTIILGDPATSHTDVGAIPGPTYYYWVTNVEMTTPRPVVDFVKPSSGLLAGGNAVTIFGEYFATGSTVKFGAFNATSVVVVNANTITCTVPAGAATGAVNIEVKSPNLQFGTKLLGYTYY